MAAMSDALSSTDTGSATTATTTNASSYDPTSTLSTMEAINNTDSPLMQQAAATAKRSAARSGLMNSSLAIGAAQGAVTAQSADLANSAVAANQNQQQIEEAKRSALVTEGQSQQQITNQADQFTKSLDQQKSEQQQALNIFQAEQNLEWQKLSEQSDQFAQSIQANVRGSYTDAANNILNNSSVNINNIASNANITAADKTKLINQEIANRNNDLAYLQTMYSGIQGWADAL